MDAPDPAPSGKSTSMEAELAAARGELADLRGEVRSMQLRHDEQLRKLQSALVEFMSTSAEARRELFSLLKEGFSGRPTEVDPPASQPAGETDTSATALPEAPALAFAPPPPLRLWPAVEMDGTDQNEQPTTEEHQAIDASNQDDLARLDAPSYFSFRNRA